MGIIASFTLQKLSRKDEIQSIKTRNGSAADVKESFKVDFCFCYSEQADEHLKAHDYQVMM